jgi:hypothetical protein
MLETIFLLEPYNGVSINQHTQVTPEVAEELVASGKATRIELTKQTKSETKKVIK